MYKFVFILSGLLLLSGCSQSFDSARARIKDQSVSAMQTAKEGINETTDRLRTTAQSIQNNAIKDINQGKALIAQGSEVASLHATRLTYLSQDLQTEFANAIKTASGTGQSTPTSSTGTAVSSGCRLYITNECRYSTEQLADLGDQKNHVDVINCDIDPKSCAEAGIDLTPTWVDKYGKKYEGLQDPSTLACN